MSKYQYSQRARKLLDAGVDVRDFSSSTCLMEGCRGQDVALLQAMLSEEGYYNPVDGGIHGFFGSATKEALQLWQKDMNVEITGRFDYASKMAYLDCLERKTFGLYDEQRGGLSTAPVVPSKGITAVTDQAIPVMAYVVIGFAFWKITSTISELVGRSKRMPRARRATKKAALTTNPAPEQVPYAAEGNTEAEEIKSSSTRRLSREELEMRIAPMKNINVIRPKKVRGAVSPYRAATSRPTARARPEGDADSISTKYGVYYGGKDVLNSIKQDLDRSKRDSSSQAHRESNSVNFSSASTVSSSSSRSDAGSFKDLKNSIKTSQDPLSSAEILSGTDLDPDASERVPLSSASVGGQVDGATGPGSDAGDKERYPVGPNDTVILHDKPIKLHKPSRLIR